MSGTSWLVDPNRADGGTCSSRGLRREKGRCMDKMVAQTSSRVRPIAKGLQSHCGASVRAVAPFPSEPRKNNNIGCGHCPS